MKLLKFISILIPIYCVSQAKVDTIHIQPKIELEEVVVFGEKKIKSTKLGFLNKENFTFSLYKDYEVGIYISNQGQFQEILDVYLKINNELPSNCKIQIRFYQFNGHPTELITKLKATIEPGNKKKQIVSTDKLNIPFPSGGVFISTKILSDLKKNDDFHLRIYLTEKYATQATFIRGAIYGDEWNSLSVLNLGNSPFVNACIGVYATK